MSPLSSFVNVPSSPPVRLGGSPVFATVPCTPRASRRTPGPLLSPLCPPRALGAARAFAWPALSLRAGLSSSVPSSEKFPLSSRAAKPGSSFCVPRRSPLHPALSPTLSRAFTCLSPVSPVIQRTMRGWGPCASRPGVQGACPCLLYERGNEPVLIRGALPTPLRPLHSQPQLGRPLLLLREGSGREEVVTPVDWFPPPPPRPESRLHTTLPSQGQELNFKLFFPGGLLILLRKKAKGPCVCVVCP